ncbi:hypothetical protein F2Q70_00035014 [Brassica cretica]|uniref:PORR domain-containing protein n=1 Tax=Brassica cretica TaxID=69181 RepID=A0A8S9JNN8_BRACR|nr:hypothetical protein F2Q70_00035014 [Brassica cretica]
MAAATATKLGRSLQQRRTFINARVKWVGDPYLDEAVQREKNLKQLLSLKDRIVSSPSKSLPLSSLSLLKPLVNLHVTAAAFLQKYPSVFATFQPSRSLPLHTETENVLCLGEYLGFGTRLKKALVHHPGIFYMSHKIRTQTVVLREGYHKAFLIEKHPLMGMRHRYLYLMSRSGRVKKRDYVPGIKRSTPSVDAQNS